MTQTQTQTSASQPKNAPSFKCPITGLEVPAARIGGARQEAKTLRANGTGRTEMSGADAKANRKVAALKWREQDGVAHVTLQSLEGTDYTVKVNVGGQYEGTSQTRTVILQPRGNNPAILAQADQNALAWKSAGTLIKGPRHFKNDYTPALPLRGALLMAEATPRGLRLDARFDGVQANDLKRLQDAPLKTLQVAYPAVTEAAENAKEAVALIKKAHPTHTHVWHHINTQPSRKVVDLLALTPKGAKAKVVKPKAKKAA